MLIEGDVRRTLPALAEAGGGYDIMVADPPWKFTSNSVTKPGKNAMRHYPCMKLDEICALPVPEIMNRDALLFLWTTAPYARMAFDVIDAWGFEYKTELIWRKDRIATGFWARGQHEKVYLCRRGKFPCPKPAPFSSSIIDAPVGQHSQKPPDLHNRIDEIWLSEPKIELFARVSRPGWTSVGNDFRFR